jgi:hypothetical protein
VNSGTTRQIPVYGQWSGGSTRLLLRGSAALVSGTHPRPLPRRRMAAGSPYSPTSGRLRRCGRPWRLAPMGSSPRGWGPGGMCNARWRAPRACRLWSRRYRRGRVRPLQTPANHAEQHDERQGLPDAVLDINHLLWWHLTRAPDVGLGVVGRRLRAADWALAAEARERK